jgi:ABC-type multidrug transport system fused ATPase/permease subunit
VRELLGYSRPHLLVIMVAMVLGLLAGGTGLAQPLVAKTVIDTLARGGGLTGPLLTLGVLLLLGALLGVCTKVLLGWTAERVVLDVRVSLGARLIQLKLSELDRSAPGDLIARVT